MGLLDSLIYGTRDWFNESGTLMPRRSRVQVVGGSLVDDPANDRLVLTTTPGGGETVGPVITNAGTGTLNDVDTVQGGVRASEIRFTSATPVTVTGFDATIGGHHFIVRAVNAAVTISNLGGSSASFNQVLTGTGSSVAVPAGGTAIVGYDDVSQKWGLVSGAGAAPAGIDGSIQFKNGTALGGSSTSLIDVATGALVLAASLAFTPTVGDLRFNSSGEDTAWWEVTTRSGADDGDLAIMQGLNADNSFLGPNQDILVTGFETFEDPDRAFDVSIMGANKQVGWYLLDPPAGITSSVAGFAFQAWPTGQQGIFMDAAYNAAFFTRATHDTAANAFGGGQGILFLGNAITAPSTSPASGVSLWVNGAAAAGYPANTARYIRPDGRHVFLDEVAGTATFESYGAVGDGVTNDTAAVHAALNAVKAGTHRGVLVGGRTYLTDPFPWDGGAGDGGAIIGHGPHSVIKCRGATAGLTALFFVRNFTSLTIKNLTLAGDGVSSQRGILTGIADGTAPPRLTLENVIIRDFTISGAHFTATPAPSTDQVATLTNVRVFNCTTGLVIGAQIIANACDVSGCTLGLSISAGNLTWNGGIISENTTGVQLDPGGNDGHGIFSGTTFNHNTTSIVVGAIANGMTFSGCHVYTASLSFTGNTGIVDFTGCSIRPTAAGFTFNNSNVRFLDTRIESSGSPVVNESNNPQTTFFNVVDLDGTIPSFVRDRVQAAFVPVNGAQTLTKQQAVAEVLYLNAGASAPFTLTSTFAPAGAKSRRQYIRNGTSQTATFQWSSGASVSIPPGLVGLVGSDGTNAVLFGIFSSSAPLAISGSDTQVFFNDGGTLGADAGMTYNKTSSVLSLSDALAVGTSPSTTGLLRTGGTGTVTIAAHRDASADRTWLSVNTTTQVFTFATTAYNTTLQGFTTTVSSSSGNLTLAATSGVVLVSNGVLSIGATVASVGNIRLQNGYGTSARTQGNLADIHVAYTSTSDDIYIGANAAQSVGGLNNTWLFTGTNLLFYKSTTELGRLGNLATDYIAFGTTPATTGNLRFTNNTTVAVAKSAGGGTINIISTDGSDNINIGSTPAGSLGNLNNTIIYAATTVVLAIGGSSKVYQTGSLFTHFTDAAFGSSAASSGTLRFPVDINIKSRNNANSANLTMMATSTSDYLFVGGTASITERFVETSIIGDKVFGYVGTSVRLSLQGNLNDYIALGSNPAQSGYLRLDNSQEIRGRNVANDNDIRLLAGNASNFVHVDPGAAGTQFGDWFFARPHAKLSTTDATVTTIATYTIPNDTTELWTVRLVATKSDGAKISARIHHLLVGNEGGVFAGTPTVAFTYDSDWGVIGLTYVDNGSGGINIRVTGFAATTIRWHVHVERLLATAAA